MKVTKGRFFSFPDLAFDESAERCCGDDPTKDYRCVLGTPTLTYEAGSPPDPNVAVTDQVNKQRSGRIFQFTFINFPTRYKEQLKIGLDLTGYNCMDFLTAVHRVPTRV